jgi:hypothetical protein
MGLRCSLAEALVNAERQIETGVATQLKGATRDRMNALLSESGEGNVSRFVLLRQLKVGQNSAEANRLLDRLEALIALKADPHLLDNIPRHRIARLRRQDEHYFAGDLRDISSDRRLAILAVCVIEWQNSITDTIIETHDRIVAKTWREAKASAGAKLADAKCALQKTLEAFADLGSACYRPCDYTWFAMKNGHI